MSEQIDDATTVRRALSGVDPATVLAQVDELNLRSQAGVDVVVVAPLRSLRDRKDLSQFCASAPWPAVRFLAELMSHECLDRVVSSLGDAAAEPTLEQLASVIESLDREVDPPAVIATMLAVAAASGVPAAAHCRELLENSELRVPELSVVAAKKLLTPRATDDAIRQERRERRQREREARQRAAKTPPPSRHRSANPPPAKETAVPVNKVPVVPPSRRALLLTPLESQQFDAAHELVGTIVEVLVPFGDRDGAKLRPAVVVGANESELLVRPIYSKPGPTRQPLHSWHRLGLEHESFLDDHRISVAMPSLVRPSVRLNDTEWNATL